MEATIAPLPRAVMDYTAAFDLAAVCRQRDGRLRITSDPEGAETAWWCEAVKAGPVIRAARRHRSDIPVAARALGTALTDHATVLARAKAAVARIEAGMAWAQRTGVLHEFNQEYRRRRLEAHGRASGSWVTRGRRYGCGGRSPRWRPLAAPRWRSFGGSSSLPDSGPNNKTEPSPCSVAQKSQ